MQWLAPDRAIQLTLELKTLFFHKAQQEEWKNRKPKELETRMDPVCQLPSWVCDLQCASRVSGFQLPLLQNQGLGKSCWLPSRTLIYIPEAKGVITPGWEKLGEPLLRPNQKHPRHAHAGCCFKDISVPGACYEGWEEGRSPHHLPSSYRMLGIL